MKWVKEGAVIPFGLSGSKGKTRWRYLVLFWRYPGRIWCLKIKPRVRLETWVCP